MIIERQEKLGLLQKELRARMNHLNNCLKPATLENDTEGLRKSRWSNPEAMRKLPCSDDELQMAIDDFKTILAQIRKLKSR
jgi:hypothetical protein